MIDRSAAASIFGTRCILDALPGRFLQTWRYPQSWKYIAYCCHRTEPNDSRSQHTQKCVKFRLVVFETRESDTYRYSALLTAMLFNGVGHGSTTPKQSMAIHCTTKKQQKSISDWPMLTHASTQGWIDANTPEQHKSDENVRREQLHRLPIRQKLLFAENCLEVKMLL